MLNVSILQTLPNHYYAHVEVCFDPLHTSSLPVPSITTSAKPHTIESILMSLIVA